MRLVDAYDVIVTLIRLKPKTANGIPRILSAITGQVTDQRQMISVVEEYEDNYLIITK